MIYNPLRWHRRMAGISFGGAIASAIAPSFRGVVSISPSQLAEFYLDHSGWFACGLLASACVFGYFDLIYTKPAGSSTDRSISNGSTDIARGQPNDQSPIVTVGGPSTALASSASDLANDQRMLRAVAAVANSPRAAEFQVLLVWFEPEIDSVGVCAFSGVAEAFAACRARQLKRAKVIDVKSGVIY